MHPSLLLGAATAALVLAAAGPARAAETPTVPAGSVNSPYVKIGDPYSLQVDPAVKPGVPQATDFDGATVPVSAIAGPGAPAAMFASGELIVQGDPAPLVKQVKGKVVATVDPADYKVPDLAAYSLVRFDPAGVDGATAAAALHQLSPDLAGAYRVSDAAGLATLAAAAQAVQQKLSVMPNLVEPGQSLLTRTTSDAPGEDAFTWDHLNAIHVPQAWNMLARAGRFSAPPPRLAVVDAGFAPGDPDRAPGGAAPATGPSSIPCSDGSPCPWHGNDVSSIMLGQVDNGFGGAGVAGPSNVPLLFDRSRMFLGDLTARLAAAASGAKVVNMSFGAGVTTLLHPLLAPYDFLAIGLHALGIVQVAAAGNARQDVDERACLIVCWETTDWLPCENSFVICAGGTDLPSELVPDPGSNSGGATLDAGTVDVWAPFCALAGPNPDVPGNAVHGACGTSASAPLVSGVAGLLWAASPTASESTIENALLSTATPGGCAAGHCVNRRVDALAAVDSLLGDLPPELDIRATSATTVPRGTPISFAATASDPDGPPPTVHWAVDGVWVADGPTLTQRFYERNFRTYHVTASVDYGATTVPDAEGAIAFTLTNTRPTVAITSPAPAGVLRRVCWDPIHCFSPVVTATVVDPNYASGTVPAEQVTWTLNGAFVGHGASTVLDPSSYHAGLHMLTVSVTDDGGLQASDTVPVTIVH